MKNRKLIIGLGCAGMVLFICIIGVLFGGRLTPSAQPTAVPPTPMPIIWILEAPEGATHILFCPEILAIEDVGWDCALGDLPGGTQLAPTDEGCQQATWDTSYIYCHVRVLDGDLVGVFGWVNQDFVKK